MITVPDGASLGWRRTAIFAFLVWIVLGEVGAIVHRVNHETSPQHVGTCALCVAADHFAAPITEHAPLFIPFTPALEPADLARAHLAPVTHPYRSRAPPVSS